MSAELLIEAATRMRKWAEQATPGRWKLWGMTVMADQDGTSNVDTAVDVARTVYRDEAGKPRTFDAEHIAGMDPAVALAVADWLGRVAADEPSWSYAHAATEAESAIAVARAYLGRDT